MLRVESKINRNGLIWKIERQKFEKLNKSLRNLRDNIKRADIWETGIPKIENRKNEAEIYVRKRWRQNFPYLVKDINYHIQEA